MRSATSRTAGLLLLACLVLPPPVVLAAGEVEITYLGNAGFLISSGETKVLVDALYGDGIAGYPVVPPPIRRRVEAGEQELAGVDLVLASHRHGDHFDARAVARHLTANPEARFVSTEDPSDMARTIREERRVAEPIFRCARVREASFHGFLGENGPQEAPRSDRRALIA